MVYYIAKYICKKYHSFGIKTLTVNSEQQLLVQKNFFIEVLYYNKQLTKL